MCDRCYLCGKDTPMGSSNVLLHLKHHHPAEHNSIVQQLSRKKSKTVLDPKEQRMTFPSSNVKTSIKTEPPDYDTEQGPVNIKVEVEET